MLKVTIDKQRKLGRCKYSCNRTINDLNLDMGKFSETMQSTRFNSIIILCGVFLSLIIHGFPLRHDANKASL